MLGTAERRYEETINGKDTRKDRNHKKITNEELNRVCELIRIKSHLAPFDIYDLLTRFSQEVKYLRRNNRYALAALNRGEYYTVRKRLDEDWVSRKRK